MTIRQKKKQNILVTEQLSDSVSIHLDFAHHLE